MAVSDAGAEGGVTPGVDRDAPPPAFVGPYLALAAAAAAWTCGLRAVRLGDVFGTFGVARLVLPTVGLALVRETAPACALVWGAVAMAVGARRSGRPLVVTRPAWARWTAILVVGHLVALLAGGAVAAAVADGVGERGALLDVVGAADVAAGLATTLVGSQVVLAVVPAVARALDRRGLGALVTGALVWATAQVALTPVFLVVGARTP